MANDLNHIVLIGRLTKEVGGDERSYGYLPNGTAKAQMSIAVNRGKKVGAEWTNEVNYFDVTLFGKSAENLKPYLKKGQMICVDGYLKQDRWEKEGQKMSKISIVANSIQLIGGKSDSVSGGENTGSQTTNNAEPFPEDYPDEVPF